MNDLRHTAKISGGRRHPWVRVSIWSLKRHDHLIAVLRMVMMAFPVMVLLPVFAGRIDLETALRVIAFGGLGVVVLLTGLVLTRRNVLLHIDDPALRTEAYQAMLALISARGAIHHAGRAKGGRKAPTGTDHCRQTRECDR